MNKGIVTSTDFNSLATFWPGVQALAGDVHNAAASLRAFFEVWHRYGFMPENYNVESWSAAKGDQSYPLRPEMAESALYMYQATRGFVRKAATDQSSRESVNQPHTTGGDEWLDRAADQVDSILAVAKTECGFAKVKNVVTHGE